jgi:hypothetical protein
VPGSNETSAACVYGRRGAQKGARADDILAI